MLLYYFLGNRTIFRTSIEATPYLPVYSTEALIPAKVEIPSLKIIKEIELSNAKWVHWLIDHLTFIYEKRMVVVRSCAFDFMR